LTDKESTYTSVTTFNHSQFPHFDADIIIDKMMKGKNWNPQNKYWGKTPNEIKEIWKMNGASVSSAGTNLHYDIECFMNQAIENATHETLLNNYYQNMNYGKINNESEEWQFFLQFVKAFPNYKPYRTEWMIYDEDLKLAGSIDMVYENPDGTLSIFDWKRAKEIKKTNGFEQYAETECIQHLPDSNFWHYSLQLNTYKAILESKYDKKVTALYLVRLHPNHSKKTFELIKCADLSKEIQDLFEYRKQQLVERK
jgi:hypothetical protein